MNILTALSVISIFVLTTLMSNAREISTNEAAQLRASGVIQPFDIHQPRVIALHPGAIFTEVELDEHYGKHVYKVELLDANGIEWDVELDAANGNILKNHQDT